ncbi:hypothetical protein FKM82_017207 [Ascaphus truei]
MHIQYISGCSWRAVLYRNPALRQLSDPSIMPTSNNQTLLFSRWITSVTLWLRGGYTFFSFTQQNFFLTSPNGRRILQKGTIFSVLHHQC